MGLQLFDQAVHAVRYWLLRKLPACQALAPVISQSLERRLTLRERVVVRLHLWVCIWCVWYQQHLQLLRDAARQHAAKLDDDATAPAPALSLEARERLKRALARSGE